MEGLFTELMWMAVRNRKAAIIPLRVLCRPPNSNTDTQEQINKQILKR